MNKVDTEVVKFALSTSPNKSDAEIAKQCGVKKEEVAAIRSDLGLTITTPNETLKDYSKRYLMNMTESEKKEYIERVEVASPGFAWKMGEGNPHSSGDVTHVVPPTPIMSLE